MRFYKEVRRDLVVLKAVRALGSGMLKVQRAMRSFRQIGAVGRCDMGKECGMEG